MLFIYDIGIRLYVVLLGFAALFDKKARCWIKGRKGLLDTIAISVDRTKKHIWFHFPSLGEFEQGRPVLEKIKKEYPEKLIVVTFFSPSGYEIRRNYPLAEHVFYLPADTSVNARRFIDLINPEMAIFTKYDYWYHYLHELKRQQMPTFIISAIFRKDQSFFQWYGGFQRKMLRCLTGIFVQDETSRDLLKEIGIDNAIVAGDTRFDRVTENAVTPKNIPAVEILSGNAKLFIAGSTWPADEKLIAELLPEYPGWKFIIAPHEISESKIAGLMELFPEAIKYSAIVGQQSDSKLPARLSKGRMLLSGGKTQDSRLRTQDSQLLIIDSIGMLSSLYQYGDIAYIGGGFGTGIHNTLEAAVFNLPVIFGPNYQKFREAKGLLSAGAAFSIKNADELKGVMMQLQNTTFCKKAGVSAGQYVKDHTGATEIIFKALYAK